MTIELPLSPPALDTVAWRSRRFKFIAYDGDSEQFDNTFTSTMSSLLGDGYENFNFKGERAGVG